MVNRRIPREIKEAAIRLYEANVLPLAAILDYLRLSRATFFRTSGKTPFADLQK